MVQRVVHSQSPHGTRAAVPVRWLWPYVVMAYIGPIQLWRRELFTLSARTEREPLRRYIGYGPMKLWPT